ncbi:hypothetical protein Tco_1220136 [Tanacetum coccineum]
MHLLRNPSQREELENELTSREELVVLQVEFADMEGQMQQLMEELKKSQKNAFFWKSTAIVFGVVASFMLCDEMEMEKKNISEFYEVVKIKLAEEIDFRVEAKSISVRSGNKCRSSNRLIKCCSCLNLGISSSTTARDNSPNFADGIQKTTNNKLIQGSEVDDSKFNVRVDVICNDHVAAKLSERSNSFIEHQSGKGFAKATISSGVVFLERDRENGSRIYPVEKLNFGD